MRNRINRMITYRIPEQASISEADFHRLATRICEGTEQIRFFNYTPYSQKNNMVLYIEITKMKK